MLELITSRPIDRIVYNDFLYNSFWQNILEILRVNKIETVVDIGASSGLSAMWLLDIDTIKKIYCFEPDVENYSMLCTNLEKYIFNKNNIVVPYNYGIYYGLTKSEVYGVGDNSPLGYCVQTIKDRTVTLHQFTKYEGKIFELRELEEFINFPVDLIKIDVEGSEYNIIENSTVLKQAKFLLIAFHNQYESYVRDIIDKYLSKYEILFFGPDGDTYSNVLLRKKKEWQQLSFLKTN